ncbi:hypothetical protein PWT90_00816 [Aphanocladium album]|nr:hypothetical protein PWT90_00816 [Aphanocladium album]
MPSLSQNLSDEAILDAVAAFDLGGCCASVAGEFQAGECHVFRVTFSDHPSICLRVMHARARYGDEEAIRQADRDRRVYQRLESSGFAWSSRLVGASLTFDNPVGYPFLLLEFADGLRLDWSDVSPPQPARDELLMHLASIQQELLRCTWEIGDLTAQQYYERKFRRQLKQVRDGKLPGVAEQDIRDQLALLPQMLGDQKDSRYFALEHADLNPSNIIVSDNYRIIGVIDWGFAEMVPVIQASRLPFFLFPCESTAHALSDVLLDDREIYAHASADQDCLVAKAMRRAQTGEDADSRALYFESVKRAGMRTSVGRRGAKRPHSELESEH